MWTSTSPAWQSLPFTFLHEGWRLYPTDSPVRRKVPFKGWLCWGTIYYPFSFPAVLWQGRVLAGGQVEGEQEASESCLFPPKAALLHVSFVPSLILLPLAPPGRSPELQEQMFLISSDTSHWYSELYSPVQQWEVLVDLTGAAGFSRGADIYIKIYVLNTPKISWSIVKYK